jgi:hypothetical protein
VLARLGWKTPRGLGDSRGLRGREAAERPGLAAAWTGRSPPCSSALSAKTRVLNLEAHPRLTADQPARLETRRSSRAHSPDFRRASALPRSVGPKLCKGFVRTIMWFPHTSEPWLAGSRAPRAAVGRRVCPVRAIPASRMLSARHLPEHALIGGRREALCGGDSSWASRHCSLSDVLPGRGACSRGGRAGDSHGLRSRCELTVT